MEEDNKKLNLLREDSEALIGRIISMSINIEFLISKILIDYFCKIDKQEDMYKYIFAENLSYDTKKNIFSSLKKSKKIQRESFYKRLIGDMDYLQRFRNTIAHYTLFFDNDYVQSYDGSKIIFTNFGIKNHGKNIIVLMSGVDEIEDELIYSQEMLVTRANRIIAALR